MPTILHCHRIQKYGQTCNENVCAFTNKKVYCTLHQKRVIMKPPKKSERQTSPEGEGWETFTVGHCLKVFSIMQGKTMAGHFCNFSFEALQ